VAHSLDMCTRTASRWGGASREGSVWGEASEKMPGSWTCWVALKNMRTISYLPIQVSCLGLEGNLHGDPCRFALTNRGPEGGIHRYVLQASDPAVSQAWIKQVTQILESQRDFLNGEALILPCTHLSLAF
jgi:hypothetical protein